jgi:hypothetical protein
MMTHREISRVRRQMQRRIRVVLAQRRLDAPGGARAADPPAAPDRGSGQPPPQD